MDANYGGTELCPALEYTFENKTKQHINGKPIPLAVFVLTDGETGDISNIVTVVSQAVAKAERENRLLRVFVVGIADSVSTYVCEEIARAGKGIAVFVGVSVSLVQSVTFLTIGSQNHGIVTRDLLRLLDEARRNDIKDYDVSRTLGGALGPTSSSHSQPRGRQDPPSDQSNRPTTEIAVDSRGASHTVKVQLETIRKRAAASDPVHGAEGEDMRKNYRGTDRLGRQHSSTFSFLVVIDAHTKKVAGSQGEDPSQHSDVVDTVPTPTASQSDFDSPLNRPNPTVGSIAAAQQFDGSFSANDDFIRLLTGSSSLPPLPEDLAALPDSGQVKQTIWITLLALAVFAKNLQEDEVSWTMLAEKAERFLSMSLVSLGVDDTDVTATVSRLKRAAAKYVAFKFWFPIVRRSDSSVVILIVSIDG